MLTGSIVSVVLLALVIWLAPALLTGAFAYQKGYSWIAVSLCAVLLPWPIVLLVVAFVPDKLKTDW
jgi:hypothetical protein